MGKPKPGADSDKIISSKASQKAKELSDKIQAIQNQTANKSKVPSNVNPASKKIKKEAVAVNTGDKDKKAVKQQNKKKNKENKNKPKAEKEQPKGEIEALDVNKYSEFVRTENAKYNRIRRRTIEVLKVDKYQVKKAIKALITHYNNTKNKNQLLDSNDDFIYLEIILSEVPTQYSIRPLQIKLPVPIYSPENQSRFCVFSRDPQREFKDKIQDLNVPCIGKVVGYTKLVKKYPQFVDRRKLFHEFDLFFCDYRLYNLLRKPTGKVFYSGKKIPFPIDCENVPAHLKDQHKDYQSYLNSLADCTYFSMGNGPVYTVKVARVNMGIKDAVKNIIHGVYNTVPYILKDAIKHSKIRQISIKTSESISLPIFNQLSDEELDALMNVDTDGGHDEKPAKIPGEDFEEEEEDDE
jgi:ribosome biogenesis protein UTP30